MNSIDQAIEAAAKAMCARAHDDWEAKACEYRPAARTALEAALPFMQSEAWEAGMTAAKLQAAGIKPARNPYLKED